MKLHTLLLLTVALCEVACSKESPTDTPAAPTSLSATTHAESKPAANPSIAASTAPNATSTVIRPVAATAPVAVVAPLFVRAVYAATR